jgi:hypothetical protein
MIGHYQTYSGRSSRRRKCYNSPWLSSRASRCFGGSNETWRGLPPMMTIEQEEGKGDVKSP